MPILVLSARPDLEVNHRLVKAGQIRGVEIVVMDGSRLVSSTGSSFSLWAGDSRVVSGELPDAVFARVGNWRPCTMLSALEVMESCGVPTPNPSSSIRIGRDHWQTIRTLNSVSIPTPTTLAGADPEALAATAEMHLGFPLVVKKRASRQGVGVIQCRHRDHLEAILDSMWRVGDEVVVQEYIECSGVSYRLLVVGNDVVAAACFESSAGEWRSNAARGASTTAHSPNLVQREMACDAAKALGLGVCGVDLLEGPEGPIVCEVNPSPGFLHLEKATGFDVAGLLVDQLMQM